MSTYTGRLETFTDKFTYNVSLIDIIQLDESVTYRDSSTDPPTDYPGTMEVQKMDSLRFDQVFVYPESEYKTTDQQNDDIDSELLKLKFLYNQELATRSPYKYSSKYLLQIDSISLQTFQLYDESDPFENVRTDDAYKQILAFLPITVKCNDSEVEFTASDGINDFEMPEYGLFIAPPLSNQIIHTDQIVPPRKYKGLNLIQSYDQQFELNSFPQSLTVELNVNNNLFAEYYKTQYYRQNYDNRIDLEFYSQLFMSNFRIDYRVISYIDYEDNKVSRLVPEKLTYQSIKRLLEQQTEKQTDEKTIEKRARIKRRVKIELDKELEPDVEQKVLKQFTQE